MQYIQKYPYFKVFFIDKIVCFAIIILCIIEMHKNKMFILGDCVMCLKKNLAKLTSFLLFLPLSGFGNVSYAGDEKVKDTISNTDSNDDGDDNGPGAEAQDNNVEQELEKSASTLLLTKKTKVDQVSKLNLSPEAKDTLKKVGWIALGSGLVLLTVHGVYYLVNRSDISKGVNNAETETDVDMEENFSN